MVYKYIQNILRPKDYYCIDYGKIQSFIMFIGFGRSGHSIIGQIINAHPNALVADEGKIFDEIDSMNIEQVTKYLIKRDRAFALRWYNKDSTIFKSHPLFRIFSEKKYKRNFFFRGLSQGYACQPKVLGNSKAAYTSRVIANNPEVINTFESSLGVPVKFVNVIRNPFDMIASGLQRRNISFESLWPKFEAMTNTVSNVIKILNNHEVLQLRQENFLNDPDREIARLLKFAALSYDSMFITTIKNHLYTAPDKSRYRSLEVKRNRKKIEALISRNDFFEGYNF
jgi:hypothetical protein